MITTWSDAFQNDKNYKKGNYQIVINEERSTCLYLFGNLIVKKTIDDQLFITTSSWNSKTTVKALNKILSGLPIGIKNVKDNLTINGVDWSGEWLNINQILELYDTK